MPDEPHATNDDQLERAERELAEVADAAARLRAQIRRVIVGQEDVVEQILISLFSGGHALLVGVPGLAKTLLVSTIARAMHLDFSRVQFTPDLMPSDITGTEVIEEDKATGKRSLRFVRGPIFANVVLADEINRTPPKTQAALLEAMQEKQVSVGGVPHPLPRPFFVLATQNPLEQEGTYPLPEAQLDRFLFQILVRYPSEAEELEVIRRSSARADTTVDPVLDADGIERIRTLVRRLPVADHVLRYALRLVRATRVDQPEDPDAPRPKAVADYISWGAGPRASEALVTAARARAALRGSAHAGIEDVQAVVHPVLRHRILTNFNAEADQVTPDGLLDTLVREMPVSAADSAERRQLDRVVRSPQPGR